MRSQVFSLNITLTSLPRSMPLSRPNTICFCETKIPFSLILTPLPNTNVSYHRKISVQTRTFVQEKLSFSHTQLSPYSPYIQTTIQRQYLYSIYPVLVFSYNWVSSHVTVSSLPFFLMHIMIYCM